MRSARYSSVDGLTDSLAARSCRCRKHLIEDPGFGCRETHSTHEQGLLAMARILVTGATGFVGSRLCRALLDDGHAVVAVLRRSSPCHVLPNGVEFYIVEDIGPDTAWNAGLLRSVDVVVHLAAHVHVEAPSRRAAHDEFQRVNVEGTRRLLEAAAGRVGRFVFTSSVHAMCSQSDAVLTEESPCRPDTPYGKSKLAAEELVRAAGAGSPTETVVLRLPPVYGPGQFGNLSRLFHYVQSGKVLPFGLVNSRRSFIYVENLVDALLACITRPQAAHETFLVADGGAVSLKDLVRLIGEAIGRRGWLLPVPAGLMRLGGVLTGHSRHVKKLLASLAVDSSHIERRLGWRPPYSLEEGLKATANWMTLENAA